MITYRSRHWVIRFFRQSFYKVYNLVKNVYYRVCKPKTQGVKALVFNSKGEILLVRVGYMHKKWVIPGGGINRTESPKDAAVRELQEETGVAVQEIEFIFTLYHNKQYKQDTVSYFKAFSDTVDFVIDDEEIIDIGWFPCDQLPKSRSERITEALVKYNELHTKI